VNQEQQHHRQQQQGPKPVLYAHSYVQLLQQAAMTRSWSAAQRLLLQHAGELQQAHIALLWWQLVSKLQQQHRQQQQQQQLYGAVRQAAGGRARFQPSGLHIDVTLEQQQQQHPQQRQVLGQLCHVTEQHVQNLTPQSLSHTVQGLAAAVASGAATLNQQHNSHVQQQQQHQPGARTHLQQFMSSPLDTGSASAAAVQLAAELPTLLWARLMAVAGSCTAQQLAHCLEGGQLLGWQLTSSSSSSDKLCCWRVLEQASTGLLGSGLLPSQQQQQHSPCWSCTEAGQLLHALAGYVKQQRLQAAVVPALSQQQQAQQQEARQQQQLPQEVQQQHQCTPSGSSLSATVQHLADQACALPSQQVLGNSLGQGVTYVHTARDHSLASSNDSSSGSNPQASVPAAGHDSSSSSSSSASGVYSEADVASVICSLQAAALLQVLPSPARLEVLLTQLEPQLQSIPARQLLQLLQALTDLGVEPWPSWVSSCYAGLEAGLQQLQPQQLLQLLQLLPHVSSVQPSQQMLAGIAKMTAVHAVRCSWRQVAALPLSLAAAWYRPQPYWLKDYVAASSTHMVRHQQRHQQQQPSLQQARQHLQLLVEMLLGVAWLAAASRPPPAAWLEQLEQQMLAALHVLQAACTGAASAAAAAVSLPQQQQQHGALPAESAALVLAAFRQLQHAPSSELQLLLAGDPDNDQDGLSTASGTRSSSSSSSGSNSSSSSRDGSGLAVAASESLHGASHDSALEQPGASDKAVVGPSNSSAACSGSEQHQQGVAAECSALSQLLQRAGMPHLGAVTMPGWQSSTSRAASSSTNGRRRRGQSSVPLSAGFGTVDESTMLATL
jgi:hypothetical protein